MEDEVEVALPWFIWEKVVMELRPLRALGRLSRVCSWLHELCYDPYVQVRYWRENESVWDVLRYKRTDESWAQFCARTIEEREQVQGRIDEATVLLERALEEGQEEHQLNRMAAMLHSRRGLMYLTNLRNFPAALADFEAALRIQGAAGIPSALNNMAVAYLYLGNLKSNVHYFELAEQRLREGGQVDSSSVSGGNLCVSLIKQGRFEEALEIADLATNNARREVHHNPNAFHHKAFALYSLGLHDRAILTLNKALKWKPDYGEALFTRGLCLLASGREAEAQSDFERALSLSRAGSVWSYCHMYASSGEPSCEGFAPRARAQNQTVTRMADDSDSVQSAEDSDDERLVAHRAPEMPNFFAQMIGGLGNDLEEFLDEDEEEEDDDEDEEGESNDGGSSSSDQVMNMVADPR